MLSAVGLFGSSSLGAGAFDPEAERQRLVERLRDDARIRDQRILDAFARTPRHLFMPEALRHKAYEDRALPLVEQQTISQPTMIAIMLDELRCEANDRALEVGGGCGYAATLLGHLVAEVHAVEIRPTLAEMARATLQLLETPNVEVHVGDGRHGLPMLAPFQRILVSAAAPAIPETLVEQLAVGGRIAVPVDDRFGQTLMLGQRVAPDQVRWNRGTPCLFVPLVAGG
jgi:protein-L-isoaspartate(D-aspartate) O-methyltransferase